MGTAIDSFIQKKVNCNSFLGDPTDAIESPTTGSTFVKYDATASQYVGLWKTPSISLATMDGSTITAQFKLAK
jgi:hypothetical protein